MYIYFLSERVTISEESNSQHAALENILLKQQPCLILKRDSFPVNKINSRALVHIF